MNQKGISSIAIILIVVGFLVLVIVGGIYYYQTRLKIGGIPTPYSKNDAEKHFRNIARVQEIGDIQMVLGIYFQKYGSYPIVSSENNWEGLRNSLINKLTSVYGFSGFLYNDPLFPKQNYNYGVSNDGKHYIISTTFEDSSSYQEALYKKALSEDIDGNMYGINCDDPNYCKGY